jgi:hypothetical protein
MPLPTSAPQRVRRVSAEHPAGTQESGWTNDVLATAVSALEKVTADDALAGVSRAYDGDVAPAACVADAGGTAAV